MTGRLKPLPSADSPPLPADAKCLGCGYRLRGLTDARCPECGRAFDPGDAETFATPQQVQQRLARRFDSARRSLRRPDTLAVVTSAVATFAVVCAQLRRPPLALVIFLLLALAVLAVDYGFACRRAGDVTPPRRVLWFTRVCVVLSLAMMIQTDSCPHAHYVGIGPVYVAWWGDGCCNERTMRPTLARLFD